VGKPDYVIESDKGLIAVEIKTADFPRQGPYENHVAQLMAYCLFVEDSMSRPVTAGLLKYRDREVRVAVTPERRRWVIGIIQEIGNARNGAPVERSHGQPNKCTECSVRPGCAESLLQGTPLGRTRPASKDPHRLT
jgi:CRISPR-associated exonuclease Cas4